MQVKNNQFCIHRALCLVLGQSDKHKPAYTHAYTPMCMHTHKHMTIWSRSLLLIKKKTFTYLCGCVGVCVHTCLPACLPVCILFVCVSVCTLALEGQRTSRWKLGFSTKQVLVIQLRSSHLVTSVFTAKSLSALSPLLL